MKTLSSILIIIMGLFFVVPKFSNLSTDLNIPTDIILPYKEDANIKAKKQKIALIKTHIGVVLSEIKFKMPEQ